MRVLLPVLVSVLAILWVRSKLDFGQVWSVCKDALAGGAGDSRPCDAGWLGFALAFV